MEVRTPAKCQGLQPLALMRVLLLCWLCCRPLVPGGDGGMLAALCAVRAWLVSPVTALLDAVHRSPCATGSRPRIFVRRCAAGDGGHGGRGGHVIIETENPALLFLVEVDVRGGAAGKGGSGGSGGSAGAGGSAGRTDRRYGRGAAHSEVSRSPSTVAAAMCCRRQIGMASSFPAIVSWILPPRQCSSQARPPSCHGLCAWPCTARWPPLPAPHDAMLLLAPQSSQRWLPAVAAWCCVDRGQCQRGLPGRVSHIA